MDERTQHTTQLPTELPTEQQAQEELPECCRTGFLENGTPTGTEIEVDGIPCYVARPSQPSKFAIVLLTDVFGHVFPNVRVLADTMAARSGYTVYVPDIMNGDPLPYQTTPDISKPGATFFERLMKPLRIAAFVPSMVYWLSYHGHAVTMPVVEKFLKALRQGPDAPAKVAVHGFCFGGRYSVLLGATDLVDAYGAAHPSGVDMSKIADITKPGIYILAESDFLFSQSMLKTAKRTLAEKNMRAVFREYPGTAHGFAVRGDPNNPVVVKARDDAANETIAFYKSVFEPEAAL